jgi:hypothetical protein
MRSLERWVLNSAMGSLRKLLLVDEEASFVSKRLVNFFENPGEENTDVVFEAVAKRIEEGDIETVVVASISGKTAIKLAEYMKERDLTVKTVCVSGPPSWEKYPEYKFPLIAKEERKELSALGIQVIDSVDEPFKPIRFRNWWEKKTVEMQRPESDLFWMTLICVGGHGLRTALEVVFMAVEAGTIKTGKRVIGVAGTGRGADSAIVVKASRFEDAVGPNPDKRLKIEEILAMPKQTTWAGYG